MSRARGAALVLLLAAAGFVAWSWPLASRLSTHTLVVRSGLATGEGPGASKADWNLILANDQNLSLWGAADNARTLLRGDARGLVTQGQCYPMPGSTLLGEHMIELGVLAAPWWLATGDPVAAYNLSLATALAIAAAGMFLFLFGHTGSAAASTVGAIAFAFATPRLVDLPVHPAVVGTHWIPWVLWSFDRALASRGGLERASALACFAVTLLLAGLVGSYPLLAIALTGAAYGLATVVHRRRDGSLAPATLLWCAAAAVPAIAIVGSLLLAYVHVQQEWILAANAGGKFVVAAGDYLPGGLMSVGLVSMSGLVPLALLRGGAGAGAVPGLVATALAALLFSTSITLPGAATWSLYDVLADRVALFDAVRAPGKVALAVGFAVQALGAIGWSRLFARLAAPMRVGVVALLLAVCALEASPPPAVRGVLGSGASVQLRVVAPPRERIDALMTSIGASPDVQPVLDLPMGRMVKAPLALLDAAYHGHATAACYNSLVPPTLRAVHALAAGGRSATGVAELAAAGFGYVIDRTSPATAAPSPTAFPPPARLLAIGEDFAVWRLPPAGTTHQDATLLSLEVTGGATRAAVFAPEPPHELDVEVTNRGEATWTAPRPAAPLFADVELDATDGTPVLRTRARGVLPLALAAGASTTIQLVMPEAPVAGTWRANVRIDGLPQATVATDFRWVDERR